MRTSLRSNLSLVLALLQVGCATTPHMKLAPELAAVTARPVTNRGAVLGRGVLTFDRWTSRVPARLPNDHWLRVRNTVISGLDEQAGIEVDRALLDFSVSSGADTSTTQSKCIARGRFARHSARNGRLTDETSVNVPGYPRFDCEFSGARTGVLAIQPSWLTQRDSGTAEFGGHRWTVESVNDVESQRTTVPLARFGYQLSSNGVVVAAVETFGAGRVWIDPALDSATQDEIAAVMTALLYYASLLEYEDE